MTNRSLSGENEIDLDKFFSGNASKRWLVLNFSASWCVPCRNELKDFGENAKLLKAQPLLLVVVVIDEEPCGRKRMLKYTNETLRLPFPVLQDELHIVSAQYGVADLPLTVLVDPQGNIAWETTGMTNAQQLIAEIDSRTGP